MNEQTANPGKAQLVAQLIVGAVVLLSVFLFWDESRSGNLINTSLLFWVDAVVYIISGLIGFGFLYYLRKHDVNPAYRSSISNALWWTLAAFPHLALGFWSGLATVFLSIWAFLYWVQVIRLRFRDKRT